MEAKETRGLDHSYKLVRRQCPGIFVIPTVPTGGIPSPEWTSTAY